MKVYRSTCGSVRKRLIKWRLDAARKQGNKCYWCQAPFTEENKPTTEHIIPLSEGGIDDKRNIAAACAKCNNERDRIVYPKIFKKFKKVKTQIYRKRKEVA